MCFYINKKKKNYLTPNTTIYIIHYLNFDVGTTLMGSSTGSALGVLSNNH